jgi:hypothetical protein
VTRRAVSRAAKQFAKQLAAPPAGSGSLPSVIMGTVTSVNLATNPPGIMVKLVGESTAVGPYTFLGSYLPAVGDYVQLFKQGNVVWALGTVNLNQTPNGLIGPGASTNIIPGGVNRTNTFPFHYVASVVVVTTAGGGWSYTDSTSGANWTGCGSFHATPGDVTGSLVALQANPANCLISGGNLKLAGGSAYCWNGSAVVATGSGTNLRINLSATGW